MSNYTLPTMRQLSMGQYLPGQKQRYVPRYLGNVGDPYPLPPGTIPQINRPSFNLGAGDPRPNLIAGRTATIDPPNYPEPKGRTPLPMPQQAPQQRGFGLSDMVGMGRLGSLLPGASNSAAIGGMGLTAGLPAGEAALASSTVPLSSSLIGTGAAPIALDLGAGTALTTGTVGGAAGGAAAGTAAGAAGGAGAIGTLGAAAAAAGPWIAAAAAVYGLGKLFKIF